LLSNVRYPLLTGTSVPRDFVEFPSQWNENWTLHPTVLRNYAKHYQTGEPIPEELIKKIDNASKFNQGFATMEYLGASLLTGMASQPASAVISDAQAETPLAKHAVDFAPVPPRYRTPTSRTSGRAAMAPATTATCGQKCSTRTPTPGSWSTAA
jgi:peptidyl-dipeptidase Dcp